MTVGNARRDSRATKRRRANMPTYKSIRGYMKTWSEVTFAQGLDRYFELNKPQNTEWLERTKQTLEEQGLMGRRMDGSCSTGLIKQ